MYKILLIGDDCIDRYQYGTVDRLSPEAPVPVFKPDRLTTMPGMAGNVKRNLEQLDCTVTYLHTETSEKTRLIDSRSRQHIVRIDRDVQATAITLDAVISNIYDAVVISDYNKGTVSYDLIEELGRAYPGLVFVDTKKTKLHRFEGCVVKINMLEYKLATTFPSELIVTDGSKGAIYRDQIYAVDTVEVADTCGAGDTFLAALTVGYLNNNRDLVKAIKFANRAAAVTVQHTGVYAPSMEEIFVENSH